MTINYSMSGPSMMMMLGYFQFSISTAAYQELSRSSEWRWPSQDRMGQMPVLQFVGPGGDTITLPGVIYPEYRGGLYQLDDMRLLADAGQPQMLIDGSGSLLGRWVIERIEEKQTVFAAAGRPRKQEFTLSLRKFDDPLNATGGIASGIPGVAASGAVTPGTFGAMIKSATGTVNTITGGISGALASVTAVSGSLAGMAGQVLAPIQSALRTANNLSNSLADAQRMLGITPSKITALSSATKVLNGATSAAANAGQFSRALSNLSRDMTALGTIPASAMSVVNGAVVSVNKLTAGSTQISSDAQSAYTDISTS